MQRHPRAELRTADAAALLNVSPVAFSSTFHRLVGRSFADYVNEHRVDEVAQDCGFLTLSHFNAQIRQRVGETPPVYRKRI